MDGVLLVFDSRSLPNLHALATVEVPVQARPQSRHRAFSAMAGLILATVFSIVYFTSAQRTQPVITPMPASAPTATSQPSLTTPAPTDATAASDANKTPTAPEVNAATAATSKPEKKSEPAKTAAPAAKKATAKSVTTETKPEEPKKDDSKVGSILKKTGRLLKKPFKL